MYFVSLSKASCMTSVLWFNNLLCSSVNGPPRQTNVTGASKVERIAEESSQHEVTARFESQVNVRK